MQEPIEPEQYCASARVVTDREKYCYAQGRHGWLVLFGLVSSTLLLVGLGRFAVIDMLWMLALPFLLTNGLYLLLSYAVMLSGSTFRLSDHLRLVDKWTSRPTDRQRASVDVFLPVCGEPLDVVLGTWAGVRQLEWSGEINVYVLDDSTDDRFRVAAQAFGFHYLRRPARELRKAGNLRYAFSHSHGDFILLLDADFRPRADMLLELMPYLLHDAQVAIVQSPQFFDVHSGMNWVQAGAGYVQELFYRLIQPARDRWGAAVCTGSCAVYRRTALQQFEGCYPIAHSEDLWTGFELLNRGYQVRYVPVILAKGLCPDRLDSFVHQQSRWCQGSLSLVTSNEFWQSRLTLAQKTCFVSGFAYYLATALNTVFTPLPPLIMVGLFPEWVHWNHAAFAALAVIYTPFLIGWWSVYPFGLHFLTTREVSCAAHLSALVDLMSRSGTHWIVTGDKYARRNWRGWPCLLLLATSLGAAALIWASVLKELTRAPDRWVHFAPPLLFATTHALICARMASMIWPSLLPQVSIPFPIVLFRLPWILTGVTVVLLSLGTVGLAWKTENAPQEADVAAPDFLNTTPAADLSDYVVVDAFPGAGLGGVMRLREHPSAPGVYFAADFHGTIREVRRHGSRWISRIVADLSGTDLGWLFSFEVHPHYPVDRRLFVIYRTDDADPGSLFCRLSALQLPTAGIADKKHEQILIEQQVASREHLFGDLAFDRQGYLLISCGDNELAGRHHNTQQLDAGFFSGILRIEVNGREDRGHPPRFQVAGTRTSGYRIPNDNPFVGTPNVLEEFWSLGFRNPFRIHCDPSGDRVWVGEVGEDEMEQIEVAQSGSNHQWSRREGSLQGPEAESTLLENWGVETPPAFEYPHTDMNLCVIGGPIIQGPMFPELQGRVVYGDNRSGRVWTLTASAGTPTTSIPLLQLPFGRTASSLVSISTDVAGNLFFTNFTSSPGVYRLQRSEPTGFPQRFSELNVFTDLSSLTPAIGTLPYDVTVPLWSDGLHKQRWIRLPRGTQIDNGAPRWKFPPGTLLIKHFDARDPELGYRHPVETRVLLVRDDGTTVGASYVWNEDRNDAILQLERETVLLPGPNGPVEYRIPGVGDCKMCHARENPILGFTPEQLVGNNEFNELQRQGVFRHRTVPKSPSLVPLDRTPASLEEQARSYLHANCSFCHHPAGVEHLDFDLRIDGTSTQELISTTSRLAHHKIDGRTAKTLLKPGSPDESAMYLRLQTTDPRHAMPWLARTRPDPAALELISEWIHSLPNSP
ncbi:PQQ-dependent sugar dehydrogenase [Planctomicrobium piriforme]|nr:glycosyltransferase [Planctomicrobium piriforme]